MEFKDFEIGKTYFCVTDGQYIGAFHVLQKDEEVMKILTSYYGGEVRVEIVEKIDMKEDGEFEWMLDSFPVNLRSNDDKVGESLHEIIEAIFIRRNIVLKIIRGRK